MSSEGNEIHGPGDPLARPLSHQAAETFSLVLSASGLPHRVERTEDGWTLRVDPLLEGRAREALHRYLEENPEPDEALEAAADAAEPSRDFSAVWAALMLVSFQVAAKRSGDFQTVVADHGASADAIMSGEVGRAATALFLHADVVHLTGNLAAMAVFGTAVSLVFGPGLGWLMILVSGIAGNMANAFFFQSGHLSIGASTAVFGALGILTARQFVVKRASGSQHGRAWLPLAGGLALLALMGAGAHADVMAHGFGFGAGLICGVVAARRLRSPRRRTGMQRACVLAAAALIAAAWM